jgi:hypothetical protein
MLEDASKIREDLELFNRYSSKLEVKDINKLTDQYDLSRNVSQVRENQDQYKSKNEKAREIKNNEADTIYDKDGWIVVVPKTEAAAKFYGKNTRWCTAAEGRNLFNRYNSQGKLYIIINKNNPSEKYQLHKETSSYMNSSDEPITEKQLKSIPYDIFMFFKHKNITIPCISSKMNAFVDAVGKGDVMSCVNIMEEIKSDNDPYVEFDPNYETYNDFTPLKISVINNDLPMTKFICDIGGGIDNINHIYDYLFNYDMHNRYDHGYDALIYALSVADNQPKNYYSILLSKVIRGINTEIDYVDQSELIKVLKFLLKNHASPMIKVNGDDSETVYQYALKCGGDIRKLFLGLGR